MSNFLVSLALKPTGQRGDAWREELCEGQEWSPQWTLDVPPGLLWKSEKNVDSGILFAPSSFFF